MAAASYEINLVNLIEKFRSEDKCRAYLEALRWPDGPCCIRCGDTSVSSIEDRGQYECNSCRYQFSVTTGTVMHDTHLPLWKWFLAVYMIVESKKGISANQLKRTLDVAYRTAWYLCHRIRHAMTTPEGLLSGVVEIDETYIGGKPRNVEHGKVGRKPRAKSNKITVVGAVERKGGVRIKRTPDAKKITLREFIRQNVSGETKAIFTDEWVGYPDMNDDNTRHERVNHSQEEWVRGDVHTNTIEGVWGLFDRTIIGAYHKVSVKHLDRYLDELEFRFNNRDNPYIFRDAMRLMLKAEHIEYKELVA